MSGGSMDYLYHKVEEARFPEYNEHRKAFRAHLRWVALALRAIEWNDSGDGDSDENHFIEKAIGFKPRCSTKEEIDAWPHWKEWEND